MTIGIKFNLVCVSISACVFASKHKGKTADIFQSTNKLFELELPGFKAKNTNLFPVCVQTGLIMWCFSLPYQHCCQQWCYHLFNNIAYWLTNLFKLVNVNRKQVNDLCS